MAPAWTRSEGDGRSTSVVPWRDKEHEMAPSNKIVVMDSEYCSMGRWIYVSHPYQTQN